MNGIKDIAKVLGSRMLTLWLAGLFISYYVTIAVWRGEALSLFINNLANNTVFRVFYVIFCCNIIARMVLALKKLRHETSRFVLRVPLFAGIILFLFSFFMSINVRVSQTMLVGQGDAVNIPWESARYQVVGMESALKKKSQKTAGSLIFDYEPTVTLTDAGGITYRIGAFPPARIGSSYMHILNFGFGPYVKILEKGTIVSEGYVPLRLTPFGKVDSFNVPLSSYRFYLSVLPNRIIKKGTETAREYDLDMPLYGVLIAKGDTILVKGETDRSMAFDGSQEIVFEKPADWVLLEVAYDPFLKGIVAGLILLPVGLFCFAVSLFMSRLRGPESKPGNGQA